MELARHEFSQRLNSTEFNPRTNRVIDYEEDRVEFFRKVGALLQRRTIKPDDWQELLLRSEARYKIITASRQIGKTTVIAAIAVHRAQYDPGCRVLIFGPTERQAKIAFAKVARFYRAWGGFINKGAYHRDLPKKMGVDFANGSTIEAMPATENTVRGFDADLLIIDEAAYVKDAAYDSILPSISMTGGDLILSSTPHGRVGFFYKAWAEEPDWDKHDVPVTKAGDRAPTAFIERMRRTRGERYVNQEFYCSFEEAEGQVFSDHLIDSAIRMDIEPLFADFDIAPNMAKTEPEGEEEETGGIIDELWNEF